MVKNDERRSYYHRSRAGVLALLLAVTSLGCGDETGSDDGGATTDAAGMDAGGDSGPSDAGALDAARRDSSTPRADGGPACIGCGPCIDGDTPSAFEQTLIELTPQTWFEAPSSHMRDVCVPDSLGVRGVGGCGQIIDAWNGGAYDSARRRMIIWGGGHDDYWGNELYGFDLRTGTWSRITEPSLIPDGVDRDDFLSRDPLPDGQPVSRHTYDDMEFLDDLDLLWAQGGARARDGNATNVTWVFDASAWSQRSAGPGGLALASAYDPSSRQVFVMGSESLSIYDVDGDRWSEAPGFGFPPLWPRYAVGGDRTGEVDSNRRLFWAVGNGLVFVWDIDAEAVVTDDWVTTGGGDYTNAEQVGARADQLFESGGGAVYNTPAPGFAYDTATDDFVAWPNAGAPYALDLETRTWTVGGAAGAPTSETSGGTYGRWRYIAAYNVFILVNSVDENVYFYKHSSGCGAP